MSSPIVRIDRSVVSAFFTVNDLPEAFFKDLDDAADFLDMVSNDLRDAMISAGNDALDRLVALHMHEEARARLAAEGLDEDEINEELESGDCFSENEDQVNGFHVMDLQGNWLVRNYDQLERETAMNWSRNRAEACAFPAEQALSMTLAHGCVLVPATSPHPLEPDPALGEEPDHAPG